MRNTDNTDLVYLRFDRWTAAVCVEDARIRKRLIEYFQPFVARRQPGPPSALIHAGTNLVSLPNIELRAWDLRGKDSYGDHRGERIVLKNRTGVIIAGRDGIWRFSGDVARNFPQLVNLIGTLYGISLLERGAAMIHASAVVRDGRAIAIVGESGSGKSSVMVRLLERGFDFLSNDRVLLLPSMGMTAFGIPKLPRVNPGTLLGGPRTRALLTASRRKAYGKLPHEQLWGLEDKHDLDVRNILGRTWVLSAPLDAAFILTRHGTAPFGLERLDAGQSRDAFRAASKTFGAFDVGIGTRSDGALIRAAGGVPVFRVTSRADPHALAEHIAGLHSSDVAATSAR